MKATMQVVLLLILAAAFLALGFWLRRRFQQSPSERERRRRLSVNLKGRLGDATITDVEGDAIFYSYSVSGVEYTASQDISQLRDVIRTDLVGLIGSPVSIKYFPRIPANSILICEEWSGLRGNAGGRRSPQPGDDQA